MPLFEQLTPTAAEVIDSIHTKDRGLPNFQRDFTWPPDMVRDLIVSIIQEYPVGSMLEIRYRDELFEPRSFEGAPEFSDSTTPKFLVLDGQQRLTSLYQALKGNGRYKYFLDITAFLEEKEPSEYVFFEDNEPDKRRKDHKGKANKEYGCIEQQYRQMVFPLQVVAEGPNSYFHWTEEFVAASGLTGDEQINLRTKLNKLSKGVVDKILNYPVPLIRLTDNTPLDAVCSIFYTVNTKGVRLSVFDLLAAKHYAQGIRLRELRDDSFQQYPILREFDIDPYNILQIIALYQSSNPSSCTRGYILEIPAKTLNKNWIPAVSGLVEVLQILRKEMGIFCGKVLPSSPMLLPMAAVWARATQAHPMVKGDFRDKLKQWFWCGVFGNAYSKSANSQAVRDARELWAWMNGGSEPEVVRTARMQRGALRTTTQRQSIRYYGVLSLILRNGAIDFFSGQPIDSDMLLAGRVEDHHIFPTGFIRKTYPEPKPDQDEVNSILNRTLIDKETNRIIRDKAPSYYWGELKSQRKTSDSDLNHILDKHVISTHLEAHITNDNFEAFVSAREALILALVTQVTKLPPESWETEE